MVTIVDNTLVQLKFAERVELKCSTKSREGGMGGGMSRLARWGIFSQCICVSKNHIAYFKYLTILFVNYTSRKLKNKKRERILFKESVSPNTLNSTNLPPGIMILNLGIAMTSLFGF